MCFKEILSHVAPFYINTTILKWLWKFLVSHQPRAVQLIRYIWFFISNIQPSGYALVITISPRKILGYQRRAQHAVCPHVFISCLLCCELSVRQHCHRCVDCTTSTGREQLWEIHFPTGCDEESCLYSGKKRTR